MADQIIAQTTDEELDARTQTGVSTDSLTAAENEQRAQFGLDVAFSGLSTAIDAIIHDYNVMRDAAEMLWVVLANVSGGDWTKQSPDWQEAAARWRDNYFDAVKEGRR